MLDHKQQMTAIIMALRQRAQLTRFLGDPPRIYSLPPRGCPFPFLVLDRINSQALTADQQALWRLNFTLIVYSAGQKRGQGLAIMDQAGEALQDAVMRGDLLAITSWQQRAEHRKDGKTTTVYRSFQLLAQQ
ncbi:DUF3168 domain-containing protein [Polycladidibacter stylochi]|uniref:DUF3168 domain-containing protein n=1 Tax=Polycladidibacter stylochi TaxID=1807766 RepID=UPI000829D5B6|nr:DUF3168 domain-containing protein [Pseudovibrio stylochi]